MIGKSFPKLRPVFQVLLLCKAWSYLSSLLYFISYQTNPQGNGFQAKAKAWLEKKCLFSANICLCLCPNPQWLLWEDPRKCTPIHIFVLRCCKDLEILPVQPGYAIHKSSRKITNWQCHLVFTNQNSHKPAKLFHYECEKKQW